MKLFIAVKPRSKEESVEKIDDKHFIARVKASARDGKANKAVIKALARYFEVTPAQVEIVSGHASRRKIIAIH